MDRRPSHAAASDVDPPDASAGAIDFAELVNDLDALVWEADPATFDISFINRRAVEILRYPRSEWYEPGFWADRLIHPDDRERTVGACRLAVRERRDHEVEYRALAADGAVIWLRDRIRVVLSPDGDVEKLRGIMLDVTERKRAEEELAREESLRQEIAREQDRTLAELRASESRFRALAANAADAIVSIGEDDIIRFANPATASLFGYDLEDIVGQPLTLLMPERFHERHRAGLARVTATGERRIPWSGVELTGRHRSGREIPLWISFGEVVQDGQHVFTGIIRDLSERHAAERALRESDERFRQFATHVPQVFWIAGVDGQVLYVNDAYARVFGRSIESLYDAPRSWLELVHPEDRPRVQAWFDAGRPTQEIEYRIVGAEGADRWIFARSIPIRNAAGDVHRFIGTAEDITERKASRARLEQAEERYRRLVQTSPYGIYVLDEQGRFAEVNSAAERMLGRTSDEVLGRHFLSIIPVEAHALGVRAFDEILRGVEGVDVDIPIVRPSGEKRLLRVVAASVRTGDAIVGVHGIARDITIERAGDEQRRMLEGALARLPDAVSIIGPGRTYLYTNPAHAELFGYAPGDRPVSPDSAVVDTHGLAQLEEIDEALREHGRWFGRVRRRRRDGSVFTASLLAAAVPGEEGGWIFSVLRDASEDIAREQHLRRVERLASLGTLIGGVAHELNNPLTAIVGFTHLMMADERSSEDLETLETIAREAERAARIVADLRTVARNTQESRAQPAAVDLNDIVRHVLKVRSYSLATRNIEVLERLAEELPPVRGNRADLEQVVLNLVVNAEQALGQVEDAARQLVLRSRVSPSGATLHVIDNGPGIARDDLEQIFDPFFTTKSPGEGTGLGLSLVHSIVAEHGGELRVESEPGRGAEFVVELLAFDAPVEAVVRGGQAVVSPADRAETPLRVLVVDDEAAIRAMLRRSLNRRGHAVTEAMEGEEALRLILDPGAPFDVIVSDLRMPGLGGDQLLARLRESRPEMAGRVVFITGDPASAEHGGIDADVPLLMKPFRLEDVARLVEERAAAQDSRPAAR